MKEVMSRTAFVSAKRTHVAETGPATAAAERQAIDTGKLNPLVDPSGFGVIRQSRPRFEQREEDKLWVLANGCPITIETRLDTTGSMGHNVDVALSVLPDAFEFWSKVLPGYDLQVATGIFGDVSDNFVLCRPQFEMTADKIVKQLTLMVPERDGGDANEDPHYGLFGAAYLVMAYINRIGLKGYDFTVSDAPARDLLDEKQLIRIFGNEVFDKVAENGHTIDKRNLPNTVEVVQDLHKRAHAFFLQVKKSSETTHFWKSVFGKNRCVVLPSTELLPQVQAAIIGLTEGTLDMQNVREFLTKANVSGTALEEVVSSLANIPIGAQASLPNFSKRPKVGDLFMHKTDLWPIDESEKPEKPGKPKEPGNAWL